MDFLKRKDFLIISHKANIFFLCFIWIDAIAALTEEITTLEIDFYIARSIMSGDIWEMSF